MELGSTTGELVMKRQTNMKHGVLRDMKEDLPRLQDPYIRLMILN